MEVLSWTGDAELDDISGQFHDIVCGPSAAERTVPKYLFSIVRNRDETPSTASRIPETRSVGVHECHVMLTSQMYKSLRGVDVTGIRKPASFHEQSDLGF
jgi:hypothetical protein